MNPPGEFFCFTIGNRNIGIPLPCVERVLRAVAIMALPGAPPSVAGVFDHYGTLIPVIDLRCKLGLQPHPLSSRDVFILAESPERKIALLADRPDGICSPMPGDFVDSGKLDGSLERFGIIRASGGMILVYDIEKFLTSDEEQVLRDLLPGGNTE